MKIHNNTEFRQYLHQCDKTNSNSVQLHNLVLWKHFLFFQHICVFIGYVELSSQGHCKYPAIFEDVVDRRMFTCKCT